LERVWCETCGLNLRQQKELPSADAYAARIRERRWLAAEAEETDRAERKAARRPRTRKVALGLATVVVAVLAMGAAGFALMSPPASDEAARPTPRAQRAPTDVPAPPCSREAAQRELVRRDLLGEGFSGVSRLICRDFTGDGADDAAFTRGSTGSAGTLGWGVLVAKPGGWNLPLFKEEAQVGIKADGGDLSRSVPVADEANPAYEEGEGALIESYRYKNGRFELLNDERQFGEAFPDGFYEEPAGEEESSSSENCGDSEPAPIDDVTAKNIDCDTAIDLAEDGSDEAEKLGWTCTSEDTGYESSHTVCIKGDARVTFDFAV
jgi:hypothetical protein